METITDHSEVPDSTAAARDRPCPAAALVDGRSTRRPSRSELMKPLGLTKQEKDDLVAFMKTLTSNMDPTTVPVLPR